MNMERNKRIPLDFLENLCEDYGLDKLLAMNDIEPITVINLLIEEGLLNEHELYADLGETEDD